MRNRAYSQHRAAPNGFASVPGDDDFAQGIAEPFFALCGNLP
jgi:hypothetical protein